MYIGRTNLIMNMIFHYLKLKGSLAPDELINKFITLYPYVLNKEVLSSEVVEAIMCLGEEGKVRANNNLEVEVVYEN